jgi:hypothetical protein
LKKCLAGKGSHPKNPLYTITKNVLRQQALAKFVFQENVRTGEGNNQREEAPPDPGPSLDPIYQSNNGRGGEEGLAYAGRIPNYNNTDELVKVTEALRRLTINYVGQPLALTIARLLEELDIGVGRGIGEGLNEHAMRVLQPYIHKEAHIHRKQMITSTSSTRLQTHDSPYVQARFEAYEGGRMELKKHVVRPEYYVRVKIGENEWLRIAMCRVYQTEEPPNANTGNVLRIRISPNPETSIHMYTPDTRRQPVPILLDRLDSVLIGATKRKNVVPTPLSPRAPRDYHVYFRHATSHV